jgi:cytochrome c peroxidase
MSANERIRSAGGIVIFLAAVSGAGPVLWGQAVGSLKTVQVPPVPNLSQYVQSQDALVVLGKALFWDMQVGSDGDVACATCHFHAGADHRVQNQLSNPHGTFPPNYALTSDDFPFHQFSNPNSNGSAVVRDTAERAGSAGEFRRIFADIVPGASAENGSDASDTPWFSVGTLNVRQATPRNTPTIVNAVFNFRNFWDGRASNIFTGRTPFGDSDKRVNAVVVNNGQLAPETVHLQNSSLASQAVGPALSNVEMAYDGRTWPKLGRKLLALQPLARQRLAPDDSVLGAVANPNGRGLLPEINYLALVQAAFQPAYWSSPQQVDAAGNPLADVSAPSSSNFSQVEFNFPLFFGLAVQAYESTLVSDDSRFDRFSDGDAGALTSQEQAGRQIFAGRGGCAGCHTGAEFTAASFTSIAARGTVQRRGNGTGVDAGFFRTGVRPVGDDVGLGGVDDFGNPYSLAVAADPHANVDGVFKTPTVRNVEFTGPYFHNGGQATLEQVVDFYSRGGDFTGGNVGRGIRQLNLSADDRTAVVAFMKSLSDDRVRFERAPFDHPEICVPAGEVELAPNVLQAANADPQFPLSAADRWAGIPAVGRNGNAVPLQTFDELLRGIGADGLRAHTLTDACTIP